jgi:hypothetical protein
MDHIDIELTCATCKMPFFFTIGEQNFFARLGLQPPRHCPACRALRKTLKQQAEVERSAKRFDE